MKRYVVPVVTYAHAHVEVEVPDDESDPERIAEKALEQMSRIGLCAKCNQGVELSDAWEAVHSPLTDRPDVIQVG
jgi:hypothetical protein